MLCGQPAGNDGLRQTATFQMDSRVRAYAVLHEDTELLGRLSAGDNVALEAKYHTKCLVGMYSRARKDQFEGPEDIDKEREVSAIVFAELVLYIEETWLDEETARVFKLALPVQNGTNRSQARIDGPLHATQAKTPHPVP